MSHELNDLRDSLDLIDKAIMYMLAERFRVTDKVGHYKKENNLPPVDLAREEAQFERIQAIAKESGVNPEFAAKLLRIVIDEVVINHQAIIDET